MRLDLFKYKVGLDLDQIKVKLSAFDMARIHPVSSINSGFVGLCLMLDVLCRILFGVRLGFSS
jgi:hypothetical protein